MEPRPLTTWEQKERDGLLALETDEWRQKRRIAEDPNTTSDVLESFAREIDLVWSSAAAVPATWTAPSKPEKCWFVLTAEAIAAHPNTCPRILLLLLRSADPFTARGGLQLQTPSPIDTASIRGLCRNPAAALICLEKPDFWLLLNREVGQMVLRREGLPPQATNQLARHSESTVAQAGAYHISVAGELQSCDAGRAALTRFWRAYCSPEQSTKRAGVRAESYLADLVRWGFAPSWAVVGTSRANTKAIFPPSLAKVSFLRPLRRVLHKAITWTHVTRDPRLLDFVASVEGDSVAKFSAHVNGTSANWLDRLGAAFSLPVSAKPFSAKAPAGLSLEYEPGNRSPLDLLQHLAHDGNRFVRWAAQTRLADPDFVFTWYEGDN